MLQESQIHREKLTFFQTWQIIAFLGSKTPVFRQTPKNLSIEYKIKVLEFIQREYYAVIQSFTVDII